MIFRHVLPLKCSIRRRVPGDKATLRFERSDLGQSNFLVSSDAEHFGNFQLGRDSVSRFSVSGGSRAHRT
jgi:hypothetical protein